MSNSLPLDGGKIIIARLDEIGDNKDVRDAESNVGMSIIIIRMNRLQRKNRRRLQHAHNRLEIHKCSAGFMWCDQTGSSVKLGMTTNYPH